MVDLVGENYAESQGEVNDIGGVVILLLEIKPSGEKFNPAFSLFCQSDGEVVFYPYKNCKIKVLIVNLTPLKKGKNGEYSPKSWTQIKHIQPVELEFGVKESLP